LAEVQLSDWIAPLVVGDEAVATAIERGGAGERRHHQIVHLPTPLLVRLAVEHRHDDRVRTDLAQHLFPHLEVQRVVAIRPRFATAEENEHVRVVLLDDPKQVQVTRMNLIHLKPSNDYSDHASTPPNESAN